MRGPSEFPGMSLSEGWGAFVTLVPNATSEVLRIGELYYRSPQLRPLLRWKTFIPASTPSRVVSFWG